MDLKQFYFTPFKGQRVRVCTREELKQRYPNYTYEIEDDDYFKCSVGFTYDMYDFCGRETTIDEVMYINEANRVAHFGLKDDSCSFTWDCTLVVPIDSLEELMGTQKPYKYRKAGCI